MLVQPPGVVFDLILTESAVRHTLFARVGIAERRLDAVRGIVRKRKGNCSRWSNGKQVGIAQAMLPNGGLDIFRQSRCKGALLQQLLSVEQGERAALLGKLHGAAVCGVTQEFGNLGRTGACLGRVVAKAQHRESVTQTRKAQTHTTLAHGFVLLFLQRPMSNVQNVVQHPNRNLDYVGKALIIKVSVFRKGILYVKRKVDGAQAAATVGGQRLFRARVSRFDGFAVTKVVIFVHAVQEENPGLCKVVGVLHNGLPQRKRGDRLVDPFAVGPLISTLLLLGVRWLSRVNKVPVTAFFHSGHKSVGNAERDIEVGQRTLALRMNKLFNIGVVTTQDAHLSTAASTGGLNGLTGAVEHVHIGQGARGGRTRSAYSRPTGTNAGEVVTHAATPAHGFRCFGERGIDTRPPISIFTDGVSDGLNKAVDKRGLKTSSGRGTDTASGHKSAVLSPEELSLMGGSVVGSFGKSQAPGDAGANLV